MKKNKTPIELQNERQEACNQKFNNLIQEFLNGKDTTKTRYKLFKQEYEIVTQETIEDGEIMVYFIYLSDRLSINLPKQIIFLLLYQLRI